MKKKLSLLFAFAMLCACGRVMPQEEKVPQESPVVIEEHPALIEAELSKLTEELPTIQEDINENPATGYEINKEKPIAGMQQESVIKPSFDVSNLDGLYHFSGADYSSWQMVGERAVETSNLNFQTKDNSAVQDFVDELKNILSEISVIKDSDEEQEKYNEYLKDARGKRVVRIISDNFDPMLYIFPDFTVVDFTNGELVFLATNEYTHQEVIDLLRRYNDSIYDDDRSVLDRYYFIDFIGVMDFSYEGKFIEMDEKQQTAFVDELIAIAENGESMIPTNEQIADYENRKFKAVIKSEDSSRNEIIYFCEDCIVVERPKTLFFFDAADIQDELTALFEMQVGDQ